MLQRMAHPGLRGEVDHLAGAGAFEHRRHRRRVGQVDAVEFEVLVGPQSRQARLFQGRVVVVVEVVDPDHPMALGQQALADMHADEAGGAGDQDSGGHG